MSFILNILKGIGLGAGCILPGISSGVLCVIFGIYDKLVESILTIFKRFRENIIFLLPIFIGIVIGTFIFGNILNTFYSNYQELFKMIFVGIILGSIPSIIRDTNKKSQGFRLHYIFYTIITFILSITVIILGNNLNMINTIDSNFSYLFISGFLMSIGVVFPGVSSTVILMLLNVYGLYLHSISTLNIQILFPIGLGLIVGGLVFLKIIDFLIKKYRIQTMYSILGFILSSIMILLPSSFSLLNIIFFIIGFIISSLFEIIKLKYN